MVKVAEEFGATILLAMVRAELARAHSLRGEWTDAVRLFEETIALSNEHRVYLEDEGHNLASLADAYVQVGEPQRAKETAGRAIILAREQGSTFHELENLVVLARAEVALGHDDAVDPLLEHAETLISAMGALAFHPHLAEIRAERARRKGDGEKWRVELAQAQRLFTDTGATGHAARVTRLLEGQAL
jgi:tetratricopeptide (TPR) repeat protein